MSLPVARSAGRADAGSTSVVMVAVICVVMALTATVVVGVQVLAARAQVRAGADQAALAGSMVAREHAASGIGAQEAACGVAGEAATLNGATLTSCLVDGAVVAVRTQATAGVVTVTAGATAGPAWAG